MNFKKTRYANIFINTSSGVYYWREMIEGKRYFKSTKQKSLTAARTIVSRFRENRNAVENDRVMMTSLLKSTLTLYKSGDHARKTLMANERAMNHLLKYFYIDNISLNRFASKYESIWANYKQYAYRRNMDKMGRKGDLDHERRYLVYCLRRANKKGLISQSFTRGDFPLRTEKKSAGKALTSSEIVDLYSVCRDNELRLFIDLALYMGLRKTEALSIKKQDINKNLNALEIRASITKTRTARIVPISKKIEMPEFNGFLFSSTEIVSDAVYTRFKRAKKNLSFKVRYHDLRHTCATNLVKKNIPLPEISKFLGMSIKVLNSIYHHTDNESFERFSNAF